MTKLFVLFFLYLLLLQSCNDINKQPRKELCYNILNIDKEYGLYAGETEYKLLDKLLETAEQKIHPKRKYTFEDALKILNKIAEIHRNLGIKTPLRRTGEPLSIALKEKSFDCGNYVITYLSIAQKLNLPLRAVFAPKHIFLEWNDGKNCFYWETLYSIIKPKEAYIRDHFIQQKTIIDGIYLTPINNNTLFADYYNTLATYFLFKKNDVNKSYECTIEGYKKDSLNPGIFNCFGNYYLKTDKDSLAILYYSKSLKLNPNSYSSYINRGVCYLNQYNFKNALFDFKKSFSLSIDSSDRSDSYYNMGFVYKEMGDLSFAKIMFDSSIYFNLENHKAYNDRAYCYYKLSNYDSALSDYNSSVRFNPKNSLYYSNRATTKIILGDTSGALLDLSKAISLDKNNFNAVKNRARLFLDKMDYKNALPDLNKAIELDSTIAGLFYYRAITNAILGNNFVSDNDYNKYISMLKPQDDKDYFSELIWFQLISRKYKEAVGFGIIATTKFPKDYYLKSYLADAYLLDGQFDNAKNIYLKYRNKRFDGITWKDNVADDFEQLKKIK